MPLPWLEPTPLEVPAGLHAAVGGHPLLTEMLVRRGVTTPAAALAFLDPQHYTPASPYDLPDLQIAVERLERALRSGERIGVWGDFDVDGQTATTLLVAVLRGLGGDVVYHIPVRGRETHGVSLEYLAPFLDDGVQVMLTCDTGIGAHEAAQYARQRGVDLLISDHHGLPPELPDAPAVVNPQRLPAGHPLRTLPGVGTAYQLAVALCAAAGRPELAEEQLDLVALGTVADVATLTGDARYLVQRGLAALRCNCRTGLQALLEQAELNPARLSEEHIGFIIGPRLNAVGRLSDANPVVEFLLTADEQHARRFAAELEALNARRKLLCDQVFQAAQAQIQADRSLLDTPALVLSHPLWPAGVIGIVASRLVELYHRPVILIATPPGQTGRGSARSVEGIHITEAIAAHQELLLGFGGHPMAAGLGIDPARIPEFRRALGRTIAAAFPSGLPLPPLNIDAWLPFDQIDLQLVADLDRLAPFGPGNPSLTLACRAVTIRNSSPLGRGEEHLQLAVEDPTGAQRKVLWWQGAGAPLPEGRFDLAYTVRAANYRGQVEVTVEWVDARPIAGPALELAAGVGEHHDLRQEPHPADSLQKLAAAEPGLLVWQEGEHPSPLPGVDRYHLAPAPALAVWNVPPGSSELAAALQAVQPQRVYWFGVSAAGDQPRSFLNRLAGLVRFRLKQSAEIDLPALSAACAQRPATLRAGLEWLAAGGHIQVLARRGDTWQIAAGGTPNAAAQQRAENDLKTLLEETAAFRAYYLRAGLPALQNYLLKK